MGGVDVVPADAASYLLEKPLWVPSRDDINVMAGGCETFRKRSRVILHSSDAVARDGDDANSHRSSMLVGRNRSRSGSCP